jgi:hypothetical protein
MQERRDGFRHQRDPITRRHQRGQFGEPDGLPGDMRLEARAIAQSTIWS